MQNLWKIAVVMVIIGTVQSSWALSCAKLSLERKVSIAKTVVIAEVVGFTKGVNRGEPNWHRMKILNVLKRGQLFKPGQKQFKFPARTAWDRWSYKTGQIVMFFFPGVITVKCNHPIVIK